LDNKSDPKYLKDYVRAHPDNKMAWYLLGRDYAARGEQGKAKYCFLQAGEIYEAFEESRLPEAEEAIRAEVEREKLDLKRPFPLWLLLRGTFAMLLLVSVVLLWSDWEPEDSSVMVNEAGALEKPGSNEPKEIPIEASGEPAKPVASVMAEYAIYYTGGIGGADEKARSQGLIGRALLSSALSAKLSVLLEGRPAEKGPYIAWGLGPKVVMSVERAQGSAQAEVQYHDAESCVCEPVPPGPAGELAVRWQAEQEQDLVLRSALAAYRQRHGAGPAEPGALAAGYPNNWLPGLTPFMRERFAALTNTGAAGQPVRGGGPEGAAAEPPAEEPAGGEMPAPATFAPVPELADPLRIVVDLTSHRLAVVSGQAIIRNYRIGIGAKATPTPEGEFVITEKVKNPNGRSDGDFGSRGMTLSDTLYAIHGTNEPDSIDKDESLGCIRMLKEDVEELFDMVTFGTKVSIGKGGLPKQEIKPAKPFQLPGESDETNPKKRYRWLN
jgi:hypothetical protein